MVPINYDYTSYSGDRIRALEHQSLQSIKSTTLLSDSIFDGTTLSYKSQTSCFGNRVIQDHPIYQHYGFASAPLAGAKSVSIALNGSNTNNMVISTHDDRFQPQSLLAGEVIVHDFQGQSLEFRQDQTINIVGQGNINISAANTINMSSNNNKVLSVRGGSVYVENIVPSNGWSGTFSTPTGQTVRVDAGIITDVS